MKNGNEEQAVLCAPEAREVISEAIHKRRHVGMHCQRGEEPGEYGAHCSMAGSFPKPTTFSLTSPLRGSLL